MEDKTIRAKKRFGQNFLKDNLVLEKIIQSMSYDNPIVEIGPGLGDLTNKLLEIKKVKAYEVDNDLSVFLKEKFSEEIKTGRFELIKQDVLKAWEDGSLEKSDYDIVANLPYYIATAIILKALNDKKCKNMVVMIQKEVAEKFSASPKQKEFSALSVLAQSIANVKVLFDVPPSAFEPMPKVVSSVIRFEKFKQFDELFEDFEKFENFLKVAFSQPRKTLMKNLSQSYKKEHLLSLFSELSLSPRVRGHEIDTLTYHNLFKKIIKVTDEKSTKTANKSS